MPKHVPERLCIVCREKSTKDAFIKVVFNKKEGVLIDYTGKLDGRGAYLCNDKDCVYVCKKTKALNRVFKQNVSLGIYDGLINAHENRKN